MKRGILTILASMLLFSLMAQQEQEEKWVFNGYYNWGFLWVQAGRVEFTARPSTKYPDAVALKAVGRSMPTWDWVFKLRDTLASEFRAGDCLPYEFSRKAHEGSYHKTFDYSFDYENEKIYGATNKIGKYFRRDTIAIEPGTYDMLSVAWMTRGLDFEHMQPQDTIPVRILLDNKVYSLYIRFLGEDKVKIDRKRRDAYVFSPLLVEGDVFKGGENMKIWMSKDKSRVPLMVEAKILVGSVKGILNEKESQIKEWNPKK